MSPFPWEKRCYTCNRNEGTVVQPEPDGGRRCPACAAAAIEELVGRVAKDRAHIAALETTIAGQSDPAEVRQRLIEALRASGVDGDALRVETWPGHISVSVVGSRCNYTSTHWHWKVELTERHGELRWTSGDRASVWTFGAVAERIRCLLESAASDAAMDEAAIRGVLKPQEICKPE